MKVYWYWPFAREEDFALVEHIPLEGDRLYLHAIDRPGAPRTGTERVTVCANLPEVRGGTSRGPRWMASRTATYVRRSRMRQQIVAQGGFDIADVAFLNRFSDQLALPRLARSQPLVSTVHDVVPHNRRLPDRAERLLLTRLYHAAGVLVVHHEAVRDELVDRFHLDADEIEVIPLWITPFRSADQERVRSDEPSVLFQGSFRNNKGIEVLLAAIDQLRDQPITFTIAGRGEPELEELVAGAAERNPRLVAEIGWIEPERKQQLLDRADLVVLPYTSFSSQSAVLHDAFGSHLPVVVTDVGAMGDTVRTTGTGTVIAPDDPTGLAEAMVGLVTDDDAWNRAVTAARAVALNRSPEQTAAAFRAVYHRVLSSS